MREIPVIADTPIAANVGIYNQFADAWVACLRHVLEYGAEVNDRDVRLREAMNVSLSARNCSSKDLLAAGAASARLQLMIRKYQSLSVLPEYNMSYGTLFRNHCGVDQIRWLIERIARNPDSKSATIGFHLPGKDILSCISLIDCKLRNGLLHFNAVYRSQNVYASQPGNACALRELQAEIADRLGVSVGYLTLHVISAHIYETDLDAANDIVSNNTEGSTPSYIDH